MEYNSVDVVSLFICYMNYQFSDVYPGYKSGYELGSNADRDIYNRI